MQLTQGELLGTNLFSYCDNNPIIKTDSNGLWAEKFSGFYRTYNGFNVNMSSKFLSRYFCLAYAANIIWHYGGWDWWHFAYRGMRLTRIAVELFAHAVLYYLGWVIKYINKKWGNYLISHAKLIEVNNNDNRAIYFYAIWGAFEIIKWHSISVRRDLSYLLK